MTIAVDLGRKAAKQTNKTNKTKLLEFQVPWVFASKTGTRFSKPHWGSESGHDT